MQTPFEQCVTFLYTADLAATAHFYTEVVGLPLVLDQGSCRIYRVSADGFLGFCERAGAAPSGVIVTLVTQDVDGWHARLCERGASIAQAPAFNPTYNIYHCFLRDPNGYLLEIQRFCDPAWPSQASAGCAY
jgi:catechol 2,3-dioxygenase-like lactoylglutathione lyase family enzyme